MIITLKDAAKKVSICSVLSLCAGKYYGSFRKEKEKKVNALEIEI